MSNIENKYYGVKQKSITTESFNISITRHDKSELIPNHSHNKPYLCLLLSGNYTEKSQKKSIVNAGTLLYRRSNYEHANEFNTDDNVCLNLELRNSDLFATTNNIQLPSNEFEKQMSISISKLLVSINQESDQDILDLKCYETVVDYFEMNKVNGKLKWVNDVINCINDNPTQNISLNKLTQEFQLHPNYIIRKFKDVTGYKLSEYLEKTRLEFTIQKIINSEEKTGIVALESGYFDQSHLNRVFKKHLTIAPNQFKKILKG
uniref:helix-turn-helix domain-containing protein n=1 Tax=Flavobacterium sp. TaxID=239 RepID=UPI00404B5429